MWKPGIIFTCIAIAVAFFLFTAGCKKEESPGTEYIIQVDSIIHPDTITAGETLTIKYYGIIGLTDCFSFMKFDVSFDANLINTKAIGLEESLEECKADTTYLNGKEAGVFSLPAGDFIIKVNQPREPVIEQNIHVKPEG